MMVRSARKMLLCSMLMIGMLAGLRPADAEPAASCAEAIAAAQSAFALPPGLLDAIARVESGRADATGRVVPWPWTLDVEGQGSFYETKTQARDRLVSLRGQGVRSIDVGCLQVNLMHHPDAFASMDEALEPMANAHYAARYLTELRAQLGNWPAAIAAYHSSTPALGLPYQMKVQSAWLGGGVRWWPGAAGPTPLGGASFAGRGFVATPPHGSTLRPAGGAAGGGRGLDAYRVTPIRLANQH
jgi:hypothetical protein